MNPMPTETPSDTEPQPETLSSPAVKVSKNRTIPRQYATLLFSIASFAGMLFGLSGVGVAWIVLFSTLAFTTVSLPGTKNTDEGKPTIVGFLPLGFLLLTGWTVSTGTIAGLVHLSLWGNRLHALIFWGVSLALLNMISFYRKGRIVAVKGDTASFFVFVFCWGVGIFVAVTQPFQIWSRAVAASTDFTRHVVMIKDLIKDGGLVYSTYGDASGSQYYPRAPHSLVVSIWESTGGYTYADAWRALESTSWFTVCIVFLSIIIIATKISQKIGLPKSVTNIIIPVVLLVILFQGSWTAVFSVGFVNSLFAGAVFGAVFTYGILCRWKGTTASVLVTLLGCVVIAHTWIILDGALGVLFLFSLVLWLKGKPNRKEWLVGIIAVAVSAVVVFPVLYSSVSASENAVETKITEGSGFFASLSIQGDSGLSTPSILWIVSTLICFITVVFFFFRRPESKPAAAWMLATLIPSALLAFGLILITHSSWENIKYYPMKTLWNFLPFTLALAIPGVLWAVFSAFAFILKQKSVIKLAGIAILGFVVIGGLAAAGGWVKGWGKPQIVDTVTKGEANHNLANIVIPVVNHLETESLNPAYPDQRIIVYGLIPYANQWSIISKSTNLSDIVAEDSSVWLGYSSPQGAKASSAIKERINPIRMCEVLRKNPNALYVTGPNPNAGVQRLLDTGCPENVVQPDKWVIVPIGDEWYENTSVYKKPYSYPSWEDMEKFQKMIDEGSIPPAMKKK